jgi:hypothetical protein
MTYLVRGGIFTPQYDECDGVCVKNYVCTNLTVCSPNAPNCGQQLICTGNDCYLLICGLNLSGR